MAGSTWPDLTAGKKAKASEVESKFDWLEGSILPMNSGSTTDLAYDIGSETKRWLRAYTQSINPTSTAGGVAIGGSTPNSDTTLDVQGTKAMLMPRLTTAQKTALTAVNGMFVYDSDLNLFQLYENGGWISMGNPIRQVLHTQGTVSLTGPVSARGTSNVTITSVTSAKTFVVMNGVYPASLIFATSVGGYAKLTSSTNVEIGVYESVGESGANNTDTTFTVYFDVIEYT
jgi:hypothetical protein